jgi:hypothetical protein
MKINEINQLKKLNEGAFLDLLIGKDAAKYWAKDDDRHVEALKIFLKDFVGDALTSLENGIDGGFVDPSKTSAESSTDTDKDPTHPSSTEQTVDAARQHRQDVTTATNNMAAARAAQAKPGHLRTADDKIAMRAAGLSEAEYHTLNNVFESIMSTMFEDESSAESISEYMLRWFGQWMDGTDWESKKSFVIPTIKEIEKTYNSDKGRTAIQKLGRIAFDLAGKAPALPAGAQNIPQVAAASGGAASTSRSKKLNPDQVAADLAALKPREREEVLKKVKAATK